MYFADVRWHGWHKDRPEFKTFAGQKCSIQRGDTGSVDDDAVHLLRNEATSGMPKKPNHLTTGLNSGYQALVFALLTGARRVILLGYDLKFAGARSHWHDGHPEKVGENMYTDVYAKEFKGIVAPEGAEILNASPGSRLRCFPCVDLVEALARA